VHFKGNMQVQVFVSGVLDPRIDVQFVTAQHTTRINGYLFLPIQKNQDTATGRRQHRNPRTLSPFATPDLLTPWNINRYQGPSILQGVEKVQDDQHSAIAKEVISSDRLSTRWLCHGDFEVLNALLAEEECDPKEKTRVDEQECKIFPFLLLSF